MFMLCRCHPAYLSEEAHKTLSQPGAFDGLRIHTDEFVEVLARIKPETVTVAVVCFSSYFPILSSILIELLFGVDHGPHGLVRPGGRFRDGGDSRGQ